MAIRRVQASCSWDPDISDTPEYVLKTRQLAHCHSLLSTEALLALPAPEDIQRSTLADHPHLPYSANLSATSAI